MNYLFDQLLNKVVPGRKQKEVDDYFKAVEARQALAHGQYNNDPRNDNSVYKGTTEDLTTTTPSPYNVLRKKVTEFLGSTFKGPGIESVTPTPVQAGPPTLTPTPTMSYPLPTTTPYPSPTPIPGMGSGSMSADTNKFIEAVILPMAKRYGVDPGIMAGQFANEGRLSGIGADKNNFYNIGVTDSMVEEAKRTGDWSKVPQYGSPEAGVERYLKFISGTAEDSMYANGVDGKNGKVGKKQFAEAWNKYKNNPPEFLKAIGPTYASSGEAYAQNTMNTPEYQNYKAKKVI